LGLQARKEGKKNGTFFVAEAGLFFFLLLVLGPVIGRFEHLIQSNSLPSFLFRASA
jgi:hypothetical protein